MTTSYRPSARTLAHRIEAAVAGLETAERHRRTDELERLRTDCGCQMGLALTVIALATWISVLAHDGGLFLSWSTVTAGSAVLLVGGTVGKALGMLAARVRLRRALRHLEAGTGWGATERKGLTERT